MACKFSRHSVGSGIGAGTAGATGIGQVTGTGALTSGGADVRVTLEIDARLPDGVPDNVVRIVAEDCRTLKFESQGFEKE